MVIFRQKASIATLLSWDTTMEVRFSVFWGMVHNVVHNKGAPGCLSVRRSASCSFTDGICPGFVNDFTKAITWILVNKDDKKLEVPHPQFDHTAMQSQLITHVLRFLCS